MSLWQIHPVAMQFCRKYAGEVSGGMHPVFAHIRRKVVLLKLNGRQFVEKGRKMRQELLASTKSSAYNTK